MYIYDLPYDISKDLFQLLDVDDYWKDLAGNMKYSPLEIMEIDQLATRGQTSPTKHLFTLWGQLNHKVDELFVLLYRMKHIPALQCLAPVVTDDCRKLLNKYKNSNSAKHAKTAVVKDKVSQKSQRTEGNHSSIPLPVMLMEKGVPQPTASSHNTQTSNSYRSSSVSSSAGGNYAIDELLKVSVIPQINYNELRDATNNWSRTNVLGSGGFGTVYRGEWRFLPIAVKRLQREDDGSHKELIAEMCLNQYRHDNILSLYGFSLGGAEACLVYQLMEGGSLEQRLRRRTHHPPLSWPQRYNIAHGVARGLLFLHTMAVTPLIHGDIKPANILLDPCLMPRIGDFGLARKGPHGEDKSHCKVTKVFGTYPYLPHEYLSTRCLSVAVDVYSYGVVMVEMATALRALDKEREVRLSHHVQRLMKIGTNPATLEDPTICGTPFSNPPMCCEFIDIGLHCTKLRRSERPTMVEVYKRLSALQTPQKNYE